MSQGMTVHMAFVSHTEWK